jgi:hypothetical protein
LMNADAGSTGCRGGRRASANRNPTTVPTTCQCDDPRARCSRRSKRIRPRVREVGEGNRTGWFDVIEPESTSSLAIRRLNGIACKRGDLVGEERRWSTRKSQIGATTWERRRGTWSVVEDRMEQVLNLLDHESRVRAPATIALLRGFGREHTRRREWIGHNCWKHPRACSSLASWRAVRTGRS